MGQSSGVLFKEVSVFQRCPLILVFTVYAYMNSFVFPCAALCTCIVAMVYLYMIIGH